MRHTYYTCDRCGRSSLSTAGIVVLAAGTYTQDEIDHAPDLGNMSEDEMTVHLCPICWGKVKRMIESKRVADDEPRPDPCHGCGRFSDCGDQGKLRTKKRLPGSRAAR